MMSPAVSWPWWKRWRYALKPASWPKLLIPTVLGQVIGSVAGHGLDPLGVLFGLGFTLADGSFLVLLNDWGDQRVDALKRQMFPQGCSPKTIPDGILTARQVLFGGLAAGVMAACVAAWASLWYGRPELLAVGLGCLGLFVAYTLPPLKLNYRGGGELLEALGVGLALPYMQALIQGGPLWHPIYWALGGYGVLSLGSALASGLSDEQSDRAGGKRTFTTMLGNPLTRALVELCLLAAPVAWGLAAWFGRPWVPWWGALAASLAALFYSRKLWALSDQALTNRFEAQALYKQHLHAAIWNAGSVLALALLLASRLPRGFFGGW
jgi:1,4-dihydroxy-2-naphthoate octaprenyltransferase/chlorophyll synthase